MPAAALWRIARRPFALDRRGIGARDSGGRWNLVGTAVIYTGGTIAIAALENSVHVSGIAPPDLVLVRVELPAGCSVETPALADLPRDWQAVPPGLGSMRFGTEWATRNRSLMLVVPSAILPEEINGVLNRNHPAFAGVTMHIERPFHYDDRMFAPRRLRRPPSR